MSKPPFDPSLLGRYQRQYDALSEEDDDDDLPKIREVLKWSEEPIPDPPPESKASSNRVREFLDQGLEIGELDKVDAIKVFKSAKAKSFILDRFTEVVKDLYYAGKDILSSNRVKTSLTIIGSIAVGAAIGAAIGSVVPIIGTAIGGAVGAALTAGVAAIGGGVGFGILGAFAGSWIGKNVAKKAFKHEKRFEVPKRITNKIKARVGISSSVVQMINGYLYNRAKAVQSPRCKTYYKRLRRMGILEASPLAMEKIARFFCSELMLLERELKLNKDNEQLRNEIKAVVFILRKLKAADGLSLQTQERITEAFKAYKQKQVTLPTVNLRQGVEFDTVKGEISPEVLAKSTGRFLEALPDGVQVVKTELKTSAKGPAVRYSHQLKTADGQQLPPLEVQASKDKREHLITRVSVPASELNESNEKVMKRVFVAQAKAHFENLAHQAKPVHPEKITLLAHGDDELAVKLLIDAMKSGIKAVLSDKEYPPKNKAAQQRKQDILEKVKKASKSSTPRLVPPTKSKSE